jgi:hypothetical protein
MKLRKMPNYDEVSLQIAIDADIALPSHINELDFEHQIKSNKIIKWDVNPTVLDEKCIRILLDPSTFNYWIGIQRVTSFVGTFMAYWCLRTWTSEMLLILILLPLTIIALPHFLFIISIGIVIGAKTYFNMDIPLFWVLILLTGISFSINKTSEHRAKYAITKQALNNIESFWRYYSNQIIFINWATNIEISKELLIRYPELLLQEVENSS